jgi:hypothetical protein
MSEAVQLRTSGGSRRDLADSEAMDRNKLDKVWNRHLLKGLVPTLSSDLGKLVRVPVLLLSQKVIRAR